MPPCNPSCPTQSMHDSILKSPSPGMRTRPSGSIAARPSIMHELRAAGAAGAAGAAAVEQGAVDQPVAQQAQQAQQAEPAAAAAAVEPEAAAGEPAAAAPQHAQQQGDAEQAATAVERTGSSPLQGPGAKRQRTSPRRSPKPLPEDSGGCSSLSSGSLAGQRWVAALTCRLCKSTSCLPLFCSTCLLDTVLPLHRCLAGRPGGSVRFNLPDGAGAGPSGLTTGAAGSPGTSTGRA